MNPGNHSWIAFLLLFLVGCASVPSSGPNYDETKPQLFLPNAQLAPLRGIAMGLAVSKGWQVRELNDRAFLAQRTLNPTTAQQLFPKSGSVPSRIQVQTRFFPREQGIAVVLDAQVRHGSGEGEKRADFTETFRPELMASLQDLRRAWEQYGWRVAAAIPPLPDRKPVEPLVSSEAAPSEQGDAAPQMNTESNPWHLKEEQRIDTAAPATSESAPAEQTTSWTIATEQATASPVEERILVPTAEEKHSPATPPPIGTWVYYAESYARAQDCVLTDAGAVLSRREPNSAELYSVDCADGRHLLVRCLAGRCQGMR